MIRIVNVPEFEIEFDRRLVAAFYNLCERHYSSDVKGLVSLHSGFGGTVNGPITIAAMRLEDMMDSSMVLGLEPINAPIPEPTVKVQVTMRTLDIMCKAMEMTSTTPPWAQSVLRHFREKCHTAMQATKKQEADTDLLDQLSKHLPSTLLDRVNAVFAKVWK